MYAIPGVRQGALEAMQNADVSASGRMEERERWKMEDGSGMRDAGNMKRGDEDEDEDESPRSACGCQEEVPVGASRDQYCA